MSQGTFSDTLIRLEALTSIFVFGANIEFFLRGKSMLFWPKMTKFSSRHFLLVYFPRDLGVSKNSIGNHF